MSGHEGTNFAVSTIIEDMFEYFDDELLDEHKRYKKLYGELRTPSCTDRFLRRGSCRISSGSQAAANVGPDESTNGRIEDLSAHPPAEPLQLPGPIERAAQSEAREYFGYAANLQRILKGLPGSIGVMRPALGVLECGWVEHKRDYDGQLRWWPTERGRESIKNGTVATLASLEEPGGRN